MPDELRRQHDVRAGGRVEHGEERMLDVFALGTVLLDEVRLRNGRRLGPR